MGRRVIWIVLDSVGAGWLPDAAAYGDEGSDTIGHILEKYPETELENLKKLGLFNIDGTSFQKNAGNVIGCYGKCAEISSGKDTTTGHWEMAGIYTKKPFPTYPDGFPDEVINEFIEKTGCKNIYGNKVASGVPIIAEYGEEHMKTGFPIVYTSADSVFQIAASEEKVGLDKLYEMCSIARNILQGEHAVGRVIARPFVRVSDRPDEPHFERTSNRRDFALKPPEENVLSLIKAAGKSVVAVGKISDIFAHAGITEELHTTGNDDGMLKTASFMETVEEGLIFTNLVDFDMKYGHRRDVKGYRDALVSFDAWLGENLSSLRDDDMLVINADHGCDPTYRGSDHTREYIPLLVYGKKLRHGVNLGTRGTFADIGRTVLEYLAGDGNGSLEIGKSFLDLML